MTSAIPSRRQFLQGLLAVCALNRVSAAAHRSAFNPQWILVGTQDGGGIFRARWNAITGQLSHPELAVSTPHPTYLALHPHLPVVYACNEVDTPEAAVSAFTFDRASAILTPLASQQTQGGSPCFASVDRTGRLLFAANYGGGSLAAFPLDAQGKPSAADLFPCANNPVCGTHGPVPERQDGPHIHCAVLSPDNRFVLACDLGDDAILVFPIHPGTDNPLGPPQRIPARAGSGPRHLAFHPNRRWLYCIHELDCTVDLYTWRSRHHEAEAQLVPDVLMHLAARPDGLQDGKPITSAEIAITRDGRFLYTCTRGIDVLTSFRIDRSTGALTRVQEILCGGRTPRFFGLDPSERWLLCTNQDGGTVTIFKRNASSGMLEPHGTVNNPSPMCVAWI